MSFTKKVNEDLVKDVRNSINDLSKTLDMGCEDSRMITQEIIEYYKKRIEIENDYGSRLLRLGEKLGEKVKKMSVQVQFKDASDTRNGMYNLLKAIESEVKEKGVATIMYSGAISNHIIPAINKYENFLAMKLIKNKKLLSTLSENMIQEINTVFNKNQTYLKNVLNEQKSNEEYNNCAKRKNSKTVKNPDKNLQKFMKVDKAYKDDIINTDRSRNQYILANYSYKSSLDHFFKHQASQIVFAASLKFGEFWGYFLAMYTNALQELNEVSNINLKNFNKLAFSDDLEGRVFFEKNKSKFVEKNLKFPLIISKKDRTNKVLSSGPLKDELVNDVCTIQDKIKKIEEELSTSLKSISEKKVLKIQWENDSFPIDSIKESKSPIPLRKYPLNVGFDYNEYLQILENCITLEMSLYTEKTKLGWINTALNKTGDIQNISLTEANNDKKRLEFGVDLVKHCTTYNVKLPIMVTLCSKYLYSNDLLKTVGIFRLSPAVSNVKETMEFIAENGYIKEGSNPIAVATTMKQYLRSMKNFIGIKDLSNILSEISHTTSMKFIEETRKIMDQLSVQSRDLLIFIAKFLRHIANMSDVNKMDLNNLSIVFGQTLFSQESLGENSFDCQTDVNSFFKIFCERIFEIFPDESRLLDFDESQKPSAEENTYVDVIDDGTSLYGDFEVKADAQRKESTFNKNTTDDGENSSSSISLTDLPPPMEESLPNELLINKNLNSVIRNCKSNNKSENEK